jgi:two-component system LytT family response regulator
LISPHPNIAIKNGHGYRFIQQQNILFCTASGSYTEVHLLSGEKLTTSKRLKEVEALLPDHFLRVHRSHLVNLNHIKEISNEDGLTVRLTNENFVPITKDNRKRLIDQFKTI